VEFWDAALGLSALLTSQPEDVGEPTTHLDILRGDGWMVAAHNDYRQDGERFTFWLLTRGDRCVKGEGRTDAEALAIARAAVTRHPTKEDHDGR
jgi:hypothetical protein